MKAKTTLANLRKWTWARLRVFNIKLFENIRWGIYQECSIEDVVTFIDEFGNFTQTHTTPTVEPSVTRAATFRAGSNFAILARLCEQYYIYEDSDKFKKKIIDEVTEIIEELRHDENAAYDFEETLDALHNNIMKDFRAAYPSLKEKDYHLYAYLVAGFSATTIAVLLKKEKSVIYNRTSRLKRTIRDINPDRSERFLAAISQQ